MRSAYKWRPSSRLQVGTQVKRPHHNRNVGCIFSKTCRREILSRKKIPVAHRPIARWSSPFLRFAKIESAGGIVLLVCSVVAIVWANSTAADFYASLLHIPVTVGISNLHLSEDLHYWINDGLMAIFFLFVGLEIKREVLVGDLSSFKLAALPVVAALGGVLFPAGIYIALNHNQSTYHGWGIPMATDIAFALGVLALSGSRAPVGVKVFLTALAIVDDIAAVLVIAFVYSTHINWNMLIAAFVLVAIGAAANRVGVSYVSVYLVLGVGIWYCMLRSGIHATIAGILLALIIPANRYLETPEFVTRARKDLQALEHSMPEDDQLVPHAAHEAFVHLQMQTHLVESPLARLERALQPWVNFFIIPLFALTNAGVRMEGIGGRDLNDPALLGIFFGLLLGKPAGILLFSWLVVKFRVADLPNGVTWQHMHAVSWLGGIGFTMSLFIAALAFGSGHEDLMSKVGILSASTVAAVVGSVLLHFCDKQPVEGAVEG